MDNINVTPVYVLAGEATFTVSNQMGKHYTYHIYSNPPTADHPQPAYFVKRLTGADDAYVYMGMLLPPQPKHPRPKLRLTAKSGYKADNDAVKVFNWAVVAIWQVSKGLYTLPAGYTIKHAGKCGRCGAKLTNPASLDTGLGPECAERAGVQWAERNHTPRLDLGLAHEPLVDGPYPPGHPNHRRTKQNPGPDRRKGPRTVHIIDEHTSYRDRALAHADLASFFDPSKHHGGW